MVMDILDRKMREAESGVVDLEGLDDSDSLQPTGVQVNDLSKMVAIYCVKTGEQRLIPKLYAPAALAKKFKDPKEPEWLGKPVFSKTPTKERILGSCKCLLHPDMPERAQYDEWGLPVCKAEHLASPEQVRQHMAHRHKSEWKQINDMRERAEREEDRAQQRAMLAALQGKVAPAPVAEVEPQEEVAVVPRSPRKKRKQKVKP